MPTTMASLALLDADVVTMSPSRPRAQAVAIADGVIIGVGRNEDIRELIGAQTRVVECGGQCLLPGFHDAHLHLLGTASRMLSLDCGPEAVSSIAELQRAIRERSALLPAGTWIRAGDYDEFWLAERRHPTRWDIDLAAPDHPVKLQHRSHHACVLNSLALKLAGIDRDCRLPDAATMEVDPVTGEPTGLVYEMEGYLNERVVPPLAESELRAALGALFDDLLSKGITSVQDASYRNGPREWSLFTSLAVHGLLPVRLTMLVGQPHLEQMIQLGLGYGQGTARLRLGPVKMMLTEATGEPNPSVDELFAQVWQAHQAGCPVAIHAVNESAVCVAIEAIANALDHRPAEVHHHRLEHASIVPPHLADRLAELGIGVTTQPSFLYYSGDRYLDDVDVHLQGWLYPIASLMARGVVVAAGSDSPVSPANPLRGICAAVTRGSRQGRLVGQAERVSIEQALWLHTVGPAKLLGLEAQLGSITTGSRADMVLLDANPLSVEPGAIKDIQVEMTVVDGQLAWDRQERRRRRELPHH